MQQVRIEAETRTGSGKGAARALRREGILPAVVYSQGEPARSIQIDARLFRRALVNENAERALISLFIDGEQGIAVVKEIQQDPVRRDLLHVDFQNIRLDEEIVVTVDIELEGDPVGVGLGGILEFLTRQVEVRVLPTAIPDSLTLDIAELEIGQSVHVHLLEPPEGVEILTDGDMVIASVAAPRVEEEPVAAPEEPTEEEAEAAEETDDAEETEEAEDDGGAA